ncbi:MAG: MBL fold metallo-hydrolase [Anaerolineales bacterium]|nr:MBL fold metallo-hydrolase [Anaerolineales bacterium]
MKQIEQGIYFEDSYSGVTVGAVVASHGIIFIDAPLRNEDARTWRSALINLATNTNRILVNLDHHPDRTLGARAFETTIVAHQKTANVFRNLPSVFKGQVIDSGAEWEFSDDVVGARWAAPDITFTDQLFFHWGLPLVQLEHHPGPSSGSIWAIMPEMKVVFVGDTILPNQPPFLAAADLEAWIQSLDVLISSYKDYSIVSGRGGLVDIKGVREQRKYLNKILRSLIRLAEKDALAEETEALIPKLLDFPDLTSDRLEHYFQRLRHGLYHYYSLHYRPLELSNED